MICTVIIEKAYVVDRMGLEEPIIPLAVSLTQEKLTTAEAVEVVDEEREE
jgi:hypothetical protein